MYLCIPFAQDEDNKLSLRHPTYDFAVMSRRKYFKLK